MLADELGFTEGYVGEHVTDLAENITSCIVFLASLSGRIKTMRLGTGTVNLPNSHPANVAAQIAMLDHMLDGRLNFGISPGGLLSDAEIFGNLNADRNAMFLEGIDTVLKLWSESPPYDIDGKFWKISTSRTLMQEIGQGVIARPLQRPHPPIVVTAVAPFSKGVSAAAARGWDPISANFLMPKWVATHRKSYEEGCIEGGDPFPKSAYLFALVAGSLWPISPIRFVTASGRTVTLGIYAAPSDLDKLDHAMHSLKASMAVGRADLRPGIPTRRVQHRRGRRFQYGGDGEYRPQHLQHQIRTGQPGHRDPTSTMPGSRA